MLLLWLLLLVRSLAVVWWMGLRRCGALCSVELLCWWAGLVFRDLCALGLFSVSPSSVAYILIGLRIDILPGLANFLTLAADYAELRPPLCRGCASSLGRMHFLYAVAFPFC